MHNIDELQVLWQNQEMKDTPKGFSKELRNEIIEKASKTGKKIFRINILKTIGLVIIFANLIYMLYRSNIDSLFQFVGVGLMMLSTIIFMIIYWRTQFTQRKLDFSLQEYEFIDNSIKLIRNQKQLFRQQFKYFIVVIIISINIMYIDFFRDMETLTRIIFHLAYTLIFIAFYPIGLKIRERKFKKELQPLIDYLENIKDQIKK